LKFPVVIGMSFRSSIVMLPIVVLSNTLVALDALGDALGVTVGDELGDVVGVAVGDVLGEGDEVLEGFAFELF
jgi:hypothetical protein